MTRRIRVARAEGLRRRQAERKVTPEAVAVAVDYGTVSRTVALLRKGRPTYPRRAHVLHRDAARLQREMGGE